LNIYLKN